MINNQVGTISPNSSAKPNRKAIPEVEAAPRLQGYVTRTLENPMIFMNLSRQILTSDGLFLVQTKVAVGGPEESSDQGGRQTVLSCCSNFADGRLVEPPLLYKCSIADAGFL